MSAGGQARRAAPGRRGRLTALVASLLPLAAGAHEAPATAHYLANAGVMIEHGETRILFDPLYNESYGQYRLVPEAMRQALMDGRPPWDGIDAVFISHYHDDHFSAADLLAYLDAQPAVRLYAPEQAVAALREAALGSEALLDRVTAVNLETGDAPERLQQPGIEIEAVRIPHSGWPTRRQDVENIAWRVTLDDGPTVLHLGDADTREIHFDADEEFWEARPPHLALPPYWYFLSDSGRIVLDERLRPANSIGVHVPVSVPAEPADREAGLSTVDLFTQPGETRRVPHDR